MKRIILVILVLILLSSCGEKAKNDVDYGKARAPKSPGQLRYEANEDQYKQEMSTKYQCFEACDGWDDPLCDICASMDD